MLLKRFLAAEEGAITVDWVVLTAAVVGLATSVGVFMDSSLKDSLHSLINDALDDAASESEE